MCVSMTSTVSTGCGYAAGWRSEATSAAWFCNALFPLMPLPTRRWRLQVRYAGSGMPLCCRSSPAAVVVETDGSGPRLGIHELSGRAVVRVLLELAQPDRHFLLLAIRHLHLDRPAVVLLRGSVRVDRIDLVFDIPIRLLHLFELVAHIDRLEFRRRRSAWSLEVRRDDI